MFYYSNSLYYRKRSRIEPNPKNHYEPHESWGHPHMQNDSEFSSEEHIYSIIKRINQVYSRKRSPLKKTTFHAVVYREIVKFANGRKIKINTRTKFI